MNVLAIDPGREKCGIAVASPRGVLFKGVAGRNSYLALVKSLAKGYNIRWLVLGDGTGSAEFLRELQEALPEYGVEIVNEEFSTEKARLRYWQDRPPKGLRRLLPVTMQVPPEAYDDYVAVILAERFLKKGK